MKTTLTLIIISLSTILNPYAQDWALPSSVWQFIEYNFVMSGSSIEEVKVTGTTTIQGKLCQTLNNGIITYANNNIVYVYHNGSFHPVFYFNAQINDIIEIYDYYGAEANGYGNSSFTSTVKAKITNIENITIGNKTLKKFHFKVISPSYILGIDFTNSGTAYIEAIGGDYVLPYFHYTFKTPVKEYTVCSYQDVSFSFDICSGGAGGISISEEKPTAFQLFPNPTSDFIYLQLENTGDVNYRITDITGKAMAQNTWNGQAISVENLNNGVYFITISQKNEILGTQKIIKR